jgi:hypothetical protein
MVTVTPYTGEPGRKFTLSHDFGLASAIRVAAGPSQTTPAGSLGWGESSVVVTVIHG